MSQVSKLIIFIVVFLFTFYLFLYYGNKRTKEIETIYVEQQPVKKVYNRGER